MNDDVHNKYSNRVLIYFQEIQIVDDNNKSIITIINCRITSNKITNY